MQPEIEIKLLAECPQIIPALAELWFNELGKEWIPNASVEKAISTYQGHANAHDLPLTFVAFVLGKPVAMASLRVNDGIREDLTPWLGSVIVHPDYRKQKIGERLIEKVKSQAANLSYSKLYLLALDKTIPTWYQRLGWRPIGEDKLYHHTVAVMETDI